MTQPNNEGPGDTGTGGGGRPSAAAKAPEAPKLLDVVKFTHPDVLTGRDIEGIGVVVRSDKDDVTVAVRPLEQHYHEVEFANVAVLNAADFD